MSKAYAEAAEGLAQMSTKVSPEHYTLLLMAVTAPAIQLVVPPGITSPAAATSTSSYNTDGQSCNYRCNQAESAA